MGSHGVAFQIEHAAAFAKNFALPLPQFRISMGYVSWVDMVMDGIWYQYGRYLHLYTGICPYNVSLHILHFLQSKFALGLRDEGITISP